MSDFTSPPAPCGLNGCRGTAGPARALAPLLARVRTEGSHEDVALLLPGPPPPRQEVRLLSASSLLGQKARVLVRRPGDGDLVAWDVLVVCSLRLADALFENTAVLLKPGPRRGEFSPP